MPTWIWIALALLSLAAFPQSAEATVAGSLEVGQLPDANFTFGPDSPPESLAYQQTYTSGVPPVVTYARSAEGSIDGEYGLLSAYASVELNGIPPTSPPAFYGVSSEANVYAVDTFLVQSPVLEDGAEVELAFEMNVEGNGASTANLRVDRLVGATSSYVLGLSVIDGIEGEFSQGSISAQVGQIYRIEYSLEILLNLSPAGLSRENPTKFLVSDHQSRVYVTPVSRPAVTLLVTSGHDYTAVPEPGAAAAAVAALGVLGWHTRRGERSHAARSRSMR